MNVSRLSRRRLCMLAASTVFVAGCSTSAPAASTTTIAPISLPTATSSPVKGRLLITRTGNFFVFDLATLSESELSHFPQGAFGASPALSPDRSRIAYTYYVVPKDQQDLGGSDLYLMDAGGENPRLVLAHDQPGASLQDPAWTADGQALLATHRMPVYVQQKYQGEKVEIVRVALDGSSTTPIVADAQSPSASPDGKQIAYVTADQRGAPRKLWIADADGRGGRELLAADSFTYLQAPRFAPDGSRIAFAGVGGPPQQKATSTTSLPFIREVIGPSIAEAHGIPWEIWTVRPDGSDLRRLTHIQEDSPIPVWSADGKWLAFAGEVGLYLVDAAGQQTIRLSTRTSGGGLAWL